MEEHGIVVALENQRAVVRVEGTDSCQACSCKGFCIMAGDGSVRIVADNPLEAQEGDLVTVTLGEGRKIVGTAIVFLTPILGMFIGLFVGLSHSEPTGGVVGAIVGVAFGLVVLWIIDKMLATKSTFRPRVTSIYSKKNKP